MRFLGFCALLALLAVPVAVAGHGQTLAFLLAGAQISPAVAQQPGATNPTLFRLPQGCGWDKQDFVQRQAGINSELPAQTSVTDGVCLIQDWSARTVGTKIAAPSPNLVLTVKLTPGGSYQVVPTWDSYLRAWMYQTCIQVPVYQPGDPLLQPVGGGVGVQTDVTLTVANPTGKTVQDIRYYWGFWPGTCS